MQVICDKKCRSISLWSCQWPVSEKQNFGYDCSIPLMAHSVRQRRALFIETTIMNRIVHFEIQADDLERAKKFYEEVFGWEIAKWEGGSMEYMMVMTAPSGSTEPGISGGLLKRPCPAPALGAGTNAFVCTAQVDDFDAIATKIAAAGGKVAMPKFALPGMAWQGYFIDTEGNTFGIHQPDKEAK